MKRIYLILIITFSVTSHTFSQVSWEKLFSKKSTDVFRCVQEISGNGGYIAAGYTADSTVNDTDAFVARFNLNGDTLWTFTYNGGSNGKELFYKIISTTDGGFITCGYTTSVTGTSDDFLYIKLNSSGHLQWAKTYGGTGKDRAQDIVQTIDGYTIAGYTTSPPALYFDVLIVHTDLNGDTLWTKIFGKSNYDDANSIKVLADGGYILGGQSNNGANGLDQFLIRTNASGDSIWTKRFGTVETDNIESITLVADGFVLAGGTNSLVNGSDGYLVKTDTGGTVVWTKTFGGSDQDDFHTVEKTSDGGFILSGTTSSYGPVNPNMWLLKTNSSGDSSWARTFGGDNHDHGYSAIQTSDGGYLIAGHSGSFGRNNEDAYIVKVGSDGTGTNHLIYVTAYSLDSPTCTETNSSVKVEVWNFGNVAVSNIPVTVEISGSINQTLNTIISGILNAQDVATITLTPTINTTVGGAYTFHAYTGVTNTVLPVNNSFTTSISLLPCTGIDDIQSLLGFSIYPNPSNGIVVIDFSEKYSKTAIEIINSTGAVVKNILVNNTVGLKIPIDLSPFSKGIYLFKVITDDGFDVRRIILE